MSPSVTRLRWQALVTTIKTVVQHFTSRNYPRDWDLAFHIQFAVLRRLDATTLEWTIEEVNSSGSRLMKLQNFSMNYLSQPKGGWFIPVTVELSEIEKTGFETEMRRALEELGPGFELPDINASSVRGEWQGAGETSPHLNVKEQFTRYSEGYKDAPVILCLHGGGYLTGSAAMERSATFRLAMSSEGRVFTVDYRLAPQHPFPAALIDAVVAYKYLIDPPPEALHEPIHPSKIVIAGDSSGVYLQRYSFQLIEGWSGNGIDALFSTFSKFVPDSCRSTCNFTLT